MVKTNNVPIHLLSNVPNNEFGKKVIKNIREFLNKNKYKLRIRGRGTRKEYGNASYIPLKYAERFSIYVDDELLPYDPKWKELWDEISLLKEKLSKHENYRFYSIHSDIISATLTALHLLKNSTCVDILNGYKVKKVKENYVLFLALKGVWKMTKIKISVYYYINDDKTKVYDIESMQKNFDKEIDKLTKNKRQKK